jgi:hypothetical protein
MGHLKRLHFKGLHQALTSERLDENTGIYIEVVFI